MPRPAPIHQDGAYLLWRLPGGPWRLRRVGEELEQRWVSLDDLRRLVTGETDLGDATYVSLAPASGDWWGW